MGLLRLAVLGPPEVSHDGRRLSFALRKAQALLLYLAVEGGLHPRSKLAALLWPDSEQELLGLDPQAPLALDLEVVQQAYQQAQRLSTLPSQEQRPALVTQVQHA